MKIAGIVAEGKRVGRTLGFPTANIHPDTNMHAPDKNGVYVARIALADGSLLPCVLNQGRHPTLPEGASTIEAHILDYTGDLYGQHVQIEYLEFLRPEIRFESIEALRTQIAKDEAATRAWFKNNC